MVRRGLDPFAGRPYEAREHFRLYFYAAVLLLRDRMFGTADIPRDHFLSGYLDELGKTELEGLDSSAALAEWNARLAAWEAAAPVRLPLVAVREAAGLDQFALTQLFVLGLPDEDPRFGALFEAVSGRDRPTTGLLIGWCADADARLRVRRGLAAMLSAGLAEGEDPVFRPHPLVWEVIRGYLPAQLAPWVKYEPSDQLPDAGSLILTPALRERLAPLPRLLETGGARLALVRGPRSSGRRTILRAVAGELGRGVLDLSALTDPDDPRWTTAGALAVLLHAMPVLTMEPSAGETARLPRLPLYQGPIGVRLPAHGGVDTLAGDHAVTLVSEMPDPDDRSRHWSAALKGQPAADVSVLAQRYRMTGGTIRRVARLAIAEAAAGGRETVTPADVAAAGRAVHAELLETLADRLPTRGGWDDLVVGTRTADELRLLERRCRHRERLPGALPEAFGAGAGVGVRALFTGPSGTGKSLAARLLASALGKEIYRLDLSTVVNKYLGETEKNLDRVLSRVEELDVVLLLDEGDALLTQRTDVHSSNDRYANLETNYLLQRLESFDGILVVTTNAEQSIDDAFERRLDVVIDFSAPGPAERWGIWNLHLPREHQVSADFLHEVAARCVLTGGQIRNAVLHASLLAMDEIEDGVVSTEVVEAAVRREYQKSGGLCPLRTKAVLRA